MKIGGKRLETNRDKAIVLLDLAYDRLRSCGTPEDFFALANQVGSRQFGVFFAEFGDEFGVFLEIKVPNNPSEITGILEMSFGIRRDKQSFFKRLVEAVRATWRCLRGHTFSCTIRLPSSDVTKFKDMLRRLDNAT